MLWPAPTGVQRHLADCDRAAKITDLQSSGSDSQIVVLNPTNPDEDFSEACLPATAGRVFRPPTTRSSGATQRCASDT